MVLTAAVIPGVLQQHADEAAALLERRLNMVAAAYTTIRHLRDVDHRLQAHLDGLAIAGEAAWPFCEGALERISSGSVFTAAVQAIDGKWMHRLDRLCALAALPVAQRGLVAAFGWMAPERLQGVVAPLLRSPDPGQRAVALAACGVQRVDPGNALARSLADEHPYVRGRALRTAGQLGLRDAVPECLSAVAGTDAQCRLWGAWSAVMLGRQEALEALIEIGMAPGARREQVMQLALQAAGLAAAHTTLQTMSTAGVPVRWLIHGSGVAGNPTYIGWLIGHMRDPDLARPAAEAFRLITGIDMSDAGLEGRAPEGLPARPTEDMADSDVAMDPDEGLPWPDAEKVHDWWHQHGGCFQKGVRYFVGGEVTRDHCHEVLKNGDQRQRILAAQYLCLLDPGTTLFNTGAPASRQQRLLAEMR